MVDGITPRAPNGLMLAVRNHAGDLALAIAVTNLTGLPRGVLVSSAGRGPTVLDLAFVI